MLCMPGPQQWHSIEDHRSFTRSYLKSNLYPEVIKPECATVCDPRTLVPMTCRKVYVFMDGSMSITRDTTMLIICMLIKINM